jgi:hypothetical protein
MRESGHGALKYASAVIHVTAIDLTVDAGELASRSFCFVLGVLLFISMVVSLARTIVVPRALRSFFSGMVMATVVGVSWALARTRRHYRGRDAVMAWAGPLILIVTLLCWLLGFLFAYALMIYGVSGNSLGTSLEQAGSSLFTLGFSSGNTQDQTILDFMAAATGPIVIALMIGFLPTIYGIYTDREVAVTQLSSEAGEPAWGPEYLARAHLTDRLVSNDEIFQKWAGWATSLRLTHLTYPALVHVRSARAQRHYATSLLAIMDAAALSLSLKHEPRRNEAYNLLGQGVQTFDTLYLTSVAPRKFISRLPLIGRLTKPSMTIDSGLLAMPSREPGHAAVQRAASADAVRGMAHETLGLLNTGEEMPVTLTRAQFDEAYTMLESVGFPIEYNADDAWEFFSRLRQRYEFAAYAICAKLDAPPAPWSGPRRVKTETVSPSLATNFIDPS